MADLVTRLLLNSSQFDNNIRRSTQQVQQFQQVGRNITATIGRFAGVLGIAMTAGEAFNKVLNSSQTLGDMTASNMAALKTSVDEFFYSLGSGNLSNFLTGLGDMIDKAKEAYAALDQLGNTQISYGVFSAKSQSEIADAQYIAKNKFAPADQRNAAFDKWRITLQEQQAANIRLQEELINSASKAVEARTNANITVTMEDMLKAFEADLLDPAKRDEVKSRAKNGTANYQANAKRKDWSQEQKDALAESQKQNLIIHTMLEKYSDDELKDIAAKIQQYYQLNSALKSTAREYNETANEYNNSMAKMEGFKSVESLEGFKVFTGTTTNKTEVKLPVKPVIPAGSLAELDAQIASVRKELNLAISNEDRIRINAELEALTEQKRVIEFQYKYPNAPIGKLDGKPAGLAGMVKPEIPTSLPKFSSPITNKNIKLNNEYAQSLGAIASIMGSVTNMTNEGAAAWLSWGANLISAVAAAIPQIVALTTAKKGEAIASGVASAAQTPFVGWLLAGAAAAAVVAALASIPSFSTGGIFAGNSTIGDMNLARVNAGEMILNNRQQRNLFNLLNGNGVMGSAGGGQVEFKIRGKELVGVLANYNNKTAKVR
ncbi:hypothetical protein [Bacteroides uniformis]|jgi:hypothetical protein|uniref:Tail tape measure protein n=1 Tax=Bacteroides uniformis TaxID=820 RepID=A0ABD4WI15_BACUN|nr:hypothetical protein [Bacteroides uniformis]MDC1787126.1 hypothetical protein [Bacteroides uniformis]MDC1790870.1 hypothetical protein [Bacteroides uniformis]MDC1795295.1 hypothetical protein [Bacteroides uniformis]